MVIYGLYHGLCFLPVMLSLIGPDPYDSAESRPTAHHQHSSLHKRHKGQEETVIDEYYINGAVNHALVMEKEKGRVS